MPKPGLQIREGPGQAVPAEAPLNVGILIHVNLVVEIDELMVDSGKKGRYRGRGKQHPDPKVGFALA